MFVVSAAICVSQVSGSLALVSVKGFARVTSNQSGLLMATAPAADPELDASQRAVLGLRNGASVAVIGAPGTGKTTTLVALVADRILNQGWSPDEVLVLAPSRVAATRLRDRLALRLVVPTNGRRGF